MRAAYAYPLLLSVLVLSPLTAQTTDLAAPAIRKAIAAERTQIAVNPRDPKPYIDLAYTLTDAGMVDLAIEQARKATHVAPTSAFAYSALAWVLHHNAIGVDYGKGYRHEESFAAYRQAIGLDPDDLDTWKAFADSLEHNPDGILYAPDAHLDEAIAKLRYIKARQQPVANDVEDNLLLDLFYSGKFKEVLSEIVLPATPIRDGVELAAIAADQGAAAAVTRANSFSNDPKRRSTALNYAAEGLWNMRLYSQAADLLAAGLEESGDNSTTLGKIQLFRNLKPFHSDLPATDPRFPVQQLLIASFSNTLNQTTASQLVTRNAFTTQAQWQAFLAKADVMAGMVHSLSVKTGLPFVVMQDIVLGNVKLVVEPGDRPGHRISMQLVDPTPMHVFVIDEEGVPKIVGDLTDLVSIANEALYLHRHGRDPEAIALLDWKRDYTPKSSTEDPLAGPLFPRFWTSGRAGNIETAAAALLTDAVQPVSNRAMLLSLRAKASAEAATDIDLLLAFVSLYAAPGDPSAIADAHRLSHAFLQQYPDSATALLLAGWTAGRQHDWAAWNALLEPRLRAHPNDIALLRQQAEEAEAEADFPRARKALRSLLDTGSAVPNDYNQYAWLSLFTGTPDEAAEQAAEQANLLTHLESYAILHTLACVKAAQGNTVEARQVLLQAMSVGHLAEPNEATWFAFGLIYEQYGVNDAAIAAYRRVQKPQTPAPTDTYALAQQHLKQLHAD